MSYDSDEDELQKLLGKAPPKPEPKRRNAKKGSITAKTAKLKKVKKKSLKENY